MDTDQTDPESLAKIIARSRRAFDLAWIAFSVVILLAGGIGWLITGSINALYAGLFYAVFPLIGLIQTHFFMFNPRRDPAATIQRLEKLRIRQRKRTRRIALINGTMLMLTSPILCLVGGTIGLLGSVVWFASGLCAVLWARRTNADDL